MKSLRILSISFSLFSMVVLTGCSQPKKADWPEISTENKPWVRWWWMGGAVTPDGLSQNLEEIKNAGFGGVELTNVYGARGYEEQFKSFLSPEWTNLLGFTLERAGQLGLGVDLANTSGWPFGGPWVYENNASKNVQVKRFKLKAGEKLTEPVLFWQEPLARMVGRAEPSGEKNPTVGKVSFINPAIDQVRTKTKIPLRVLMAYNDTGQTLDLTSNVETNGNLNWVAPEGNWELYAVFQGLHGKQVERAGPGGQGNVIDHFSEKAVADYLRYFDDNLKNVDISSVRAFFNDSYEVDDASGESNWTPLFFDEFQKLRGYDLRNHLPALFGFDSEEKNSRVWCDYRETLSDLLLGRFTKTWAGWAKQHQAQIRNQAHDSPANILDLYAASDIPETEGTDPLGIKFASSAGHISGKKLISCEAATWLDEHFKENYSALKQNLDCYFANGVNHVVYHGSTYSPKEAAWPGWMFYASTHFAPTNSLWNDLPAINNYVANCQAFLQNSKPANDILVYFQMYDLWSEKGRRSIYHFSENSAETHIQEIGNLLMNNGYTFDFISDRQMDSLKVEASRIFASGNPYKTILIPACHFIPLKTMEKIVAMANEGATVIFQDSIPGDIPGLFDLENRQEKYRELVQPFNDAENQFGLGKILIGTNVVEVLQKSGLSGEELAKSGLWFTRMENADGPLYFISNWTEEKFDRWVTLNSAGKDAVVFYPYFHKMGKVPGKKAGKNQSEVYLQLEKGESLILQFYQTKVNAPEFPAWEETGNNIELDGEWEITFLEGGPELPPPFKTSELKLWNGQEELKEFSGTASYQTNFAKPKETAEAYRLDLGKAYETARVFLNGNELAVLTGPAYQIALPYAVLEETNQLEIWVSNLMANRIIAMEKRGERYQNFYNINFSAKYRENLDEKGVFTTKGWKPVNSGLLGPVVLKPLKTIKP